MNKVKNLASVSFILTGISIIVNVILNEGYTVNNPWQKTIALADFGNFSTTNWIFFIIYILLALLIILMGLISFKKNTSIGTFIFCLILFFIAFGLVVYNVSSPNADAFTLYVIYHMFTVNFIAIIALLSSLLAILLIVTWMILFVINKKKPAQQASNKNNIQNNAAMDNNLQQQPINVVNSSHNLLREDEASVDIHSKLNRLKDSLNKRPNEISLEDTNTSDESQAAQVKQEQVFESIENEFVIDDQNVINQQPKLPRQPKVNVAPVDNSVKDPYKQTIVPRRAQGKLENKYMSAPPAGNVPNKQQNQQRRSRPKVDESYQNKVFLGDSDRIWNAMVQQERPGINKPLPNIVNKQTTNNSQNSINEQHESKVVEKNNDNFSQDITQNTIEKKLDNLFTNSVSNNGNDLEKTFDNLGLNVVTTQEQATTNETNTIFESDSDSVDNDSQDNSQFSIDWGDD